MKCAKCDCLEDKVIDSRISKDGNSVRRRRECLNCQHRYTTLEEIVPTELYVVKSDHRREDFAPAKIREGVRKACWKRPINEAQINEIVVQVEAQIESLGERDVPSERVGQIVMEQLKKLDEVAYVRFASVYRQFKDVAEFINEIETLKELGK